VAPPPAEDVDAGVIDDARARQRRHRRIAAEAAVAVAGVAAILIASGGWSGGPNAGRQSGSAGNSPSLSAKPAPTTTAARCVLPRPPRNASQGTPDKTLLSILGVLRRPREPGDSLAPLRYLSFNEEVFVRYIRRARVVAGSAYYVVPALFTTCEPGPSYQAVTFKKLSADGAGLGLGAVGATAAIIERRGEFISGGSGRGRGTSTVWGLVPDRVASVTLHYAAGPTPRHALTIKATVTGNVAVFPDVPRKSTASWNEMTWRAANGHIIKTFNQL